MIASLLLKIKVIPQLIHTGKSLFALNIAISVMLFYDALSSKRKEDSTVYFPSMKVALLLSLAVI